MAACPRARLRLSNSSGEWRHFGRTRNDNIPPTRDAQGGVLLVEPLSLSDPSWTSPLRKRTAVDGGSEPANVVVKLVGPHPGTCREFRQSDSPSLIEHTRCSVGPFFAQHRLTSVRLVAASDPVSTQVPRCCHLKKKKKKGGSRSVRTQRRRANEEVCGCGRSMATRNRRFDQATGDAQLAAARASRTRNPLPLPEDARIGRFSGTGGSGFRTGAGVTQTACFVVSGGHDGRELARGPGRKRPRPPLNLPAELGDSRLGQPCD